MTHHNNNDNNNKDRKERKAEQRKGLTKQEQEMLDKQAEDQAKLQEEYQRNPPQIISPLQSGATIDTELARMEWEDDQLISQTKGLRGAQNKNKFTGGGGAGGGGGSPAQGSRFVQEQRKQEILPENLAKNSAEEREEESKDTAKSKK